MYIVHGQSNFQEANPKSMYCYPFANLIMLGINPVACTQSCFIYPKGNYDDDNDTDNSEGSNTHTWQSIDYNFSVNCPCL